MNASSSSRVFGGIAIPGLRYIPPPTVPEYVEQDPVYISQEEIYYPSLSPTPCLLLVSLPNPNTALPLSTFARYSCSWWGGTCLNCCSSIHVVHHVCKIINCNVTTKSRFQINVIEWNVICRHMQIPGTYICIHINKFVSLNCRFKSISLTCFNICTNDRGSEQSSHKKCSKCVPSIQTSCHLMLKM